MTPDAISSGSARWNLLAAYESQIYAEAYLREGRHLHQLADRNVVSEPSSGIKALSAFLAGPAMCSSPTRATP